MHDGAGRIERLVDGLGEAGWDAFLAQSPVAMGFLAGFHEHAGERFMALAVSARGEVRLICPALSENQARRAGIRDIRSWKDGEDPLALFEALADEWGLRSGIVAVDPSMPARMLLQIQDALPAALFKDGEEILSGVMRRKQPEELDLLRRAGKIADDAFDEVLPQIRAGQTELQVDLMLRDAMAARGGKPTFCIVAAGANGAEPHHFSDDTVLKSGDVVVLDFGCDLEGYQSDITRTVGIGQTSDRAKQMYDLVYRAHMAARQAIRAGVPASDVDAAARQVIEAAGCGDAFFHRTGHGIGTQGHEAPYISSANHAPLEAGNCFSIEPGVYFEGELGIRIENIVAATEDGHESMNVDPSPTLIECGA